MESAYAAIFETARRFGAIAADTAAVGLEVAETVHYSGSKCSILDEPAYCVRCNEEFKCRHLVMPPHCCRIGRFPPKTNRGLANFWRDWVSISQLWRAKGQVLKTSNTRPPCSMSRNACRAYSASAHRMRLVWSLSGG